MSGFLGGLASLKFSEELKLTGTSLVGIFLFMHGWALFLGGYPDEFELGERLDNGEKVKLGDAFSAYCFVFFGLLAASLYIQSKDEPTEERQEFAKDHAAEPHFEMEDYQK